MAERCAVIGIGQTKYSKRAGDLSLDGLVRQAALRALEDAELTFADIDAIVIGKGAMRHWLAEHPAPTDALDIVFVGYSELLVGAMRRAGNRNPAHLLLARPDAAPEQLGEIHERTLLVFDSESDAALASERRLPAARSSR